jgi:hypothetical protein
MKENEGFCGSAINGVVFICYLEINFINFGFNRLMAMSDIFHIDF